MKYITLKNGLQVPQLALGCMRIANKEQEQVNKLIAAAMEHQIPKAVQNERFSRLLALQEQISQSANTPLVGKTVRVLCDGPSKTDDTVLSGRTDGNKIVFFPVDDTPEGTFVNIEIDRAAPFALYGKQKKG